MHLLLYSIKLPLWDLPAYLIQLGLGAKKNPHHEFSNKSSFEEIPVYSVNSLETLVFFHFVFRRLGLFI